jgi:hypothetical protein
MRTGIQSLHRELPLCPVPRPLAFYHVATTAFSFPLPRGHEKGLGKPRNGNRTPSLLR